MKHSPLALYIHWPFCKSKCPYCDFNSHVRQGIDTQQWLEAYLQELNYFAPYIQGRPIASIFFGGGTPSLMPPIIAEKIIDRLAKLCVLAEGTEITMEANPTSVEADTFPAFTKAGVNRISLGIQALNDQDLKFLGREHSAAEAQKAIAKAAACTSNYSFDLIYARPGQTLAAWENELKQALSLACKHLSLYQLTIEKGTPFYAAYQRKEFDLPKDGLAADLYDMTNNIMAAAGLPAYEISNYAYPGFECRHNLVYWHYEEYLGIGPGAHSRVRLGNDNVTSLMMTHLPENWLKQVATQGHGIQTEELLTTQEMLEELVMMGLRLPEGITRRQFVVITGKEPEALFPHSVLEPLIEGGMLALDTQGLRATGQGRALLNGLISKLLI